MWEVDEIITHLSVKSIVDSFFITNLNI